MSRELDVIYFIAAKVEAIESAPKVSRHFYDLSKNDDAKNGFIYAVRPGSAQRAAGTIKSITYEQDFEIEVASDFILKNSTDLAIRDAVEKIESFMEKLTKAMAVKASPIMLIKPPTKDTPVVDHAKSSVSRTYTFEITYRVHL